MLERAGTTPSAPGAVQGTIDIVAPAAATETHVPRAILHDLLCRTCGYNLRGLSAASRCPECGSSVARSLHGDMLEFCDPDWVLRLARGMNWMAIGVMLMLMAAAARSTMLARESNDTAPLRWLAIALALAAGCCAVSGLILATSPDPALARRERALAARRIIRLSVIIALLITASLAIGGSISLRPVSMIHVLAACGAWIIAMLAMFRYGVALARRAGSPALAEETRSVMSGIVICLIILAIASTFGLLAAMGFDGSATSFAIGVLTGWSCAALVGLVCLGLWSLTLIFRYRTALRRAADRARTSWAA